MVTNEPTSTDKCIEDCEPTSTDKCIEDCAYAEGIAMSLCFKEENQIENIHIYTN